MSLFFIFLVSLSNINCGDNTASTKNTTPPASDSAEIKFVSERIEMGLIEPGKNANQDFKFFNAGGDSLVVKEAKGNCHCVQAKWPEQAIAPGDSSVINISFDPVGVTGLFQRTVMVNSNATRPAVELTITGEVKADPNKKNPSDGNH